MPCSMALKMERAAHHEAGHIVIAAALELELRPDGVLVDDSAEGIAMYASNPTDNDASRVAVILATEAGQYAERHFVTEQQREEPESGPALLEDHIISWRIMGKLTPDYLDGELHALVYKRLQNRSKGLVAQHWSAIAAVANRLLAQEPEPVEPLTTGERWTPSTGTAIRLGGEAIVEILSRYGLRAVCRPRSAVAGPSTEQSALTSLNASMSKTCQTPG
jgi:hypothetical protein